MEKCLITKFNSVVSNSDLLHIGELRINMHNINSPKDTTQFFKFKTSSDVILTIIGDGYFTDSKLSENKGKTFTCKANQLSYSYLSNGDYTISVSDKYAIIEIQVPNVAELSLDSLKYSKNLTFLYAAKSNGELSVLSDKDLTFLRSNSASGDWSDLSGMGKLTYINVASSKITGKLSSIYNLKNLNTIYCSSELNEDLSLVQDSLGFISCISRDSTYRWGSTRSSSAYILGLSLLGVMEDVDTMLINQADCLVYSSAESYEKIIKVTGTRTSASDAAVATLQSKGYTVSITPA